MDGYTEFAKFYDSAMGDRAADVATVRDLLQRYYPTARSVLELGCGTGVLLKYFINDGFHVAGVDSSGDMLAIARERLPGAHLVQQDIRSFSLEDKYDAILCLFDTINHLPTFQDWRVTFSQAALYLKEEGVFIFDINTEDKLKRLASAPAYRKELDGKVITMKVTAKEGVYNWHTEVVEKGISESKPLVSEDILEVSFPISSVEKALNEYFSEVYIINQGIGTGRAYFVCKK
ncbi:MAG: class I SAM-dependent methyltransferase [Candidatus Kaiserbacteria bacterium]|nr:class I SAM-dependent methyltransferase [Candidatus Kaiserbacteria bacterium]